MLQVIASKARGARPQNEVRGSEVLGPRRICGVYNTRGTPLETSTLPRRLLGLSRARPKPRGGVYRGREGGGHRTSRLSRSWTCARGITCPAASTPLMACQQRLGAPPSVARRPVCRVSAISTSERATTACQRVGARTSVARCRGTHRPSRFAGPELVLVLRGGPADRKRGNVRRAGP